MYSRGSSNTFLPPLLRVAIILFHQNYVSSPSLAEAFGGGVIWSKNSGDFVKIFSIESYERIREEYSSISRKIETHNFQGSQLRFTGFPVRNLVNFETNEFNETVTSGAHGEMWQILSKMLNFKLLIVKLKTIEFGTRNEQTGDWDGLMGYIYRNETDIIPRVILFPSRLTALDVSLATWSAGYRLYMKQQVGYNKMWMVDLFDPKIWLSIIGLFFALVFANYTIHVYSLKNNKETRDPASNLIDHFFHIFSMFCNQGWLPNWLDKNSKILNLPARTCAWLLFVAFSSKLVSVITHRRLPEPFKDLESFYGETDYKLLVKQNSFAYSVFKKAPRPIYHTILTSGRLIQFDTTRVVADKICMGGYVYLEAEDVFDAMKFEQCKYNVVGRAYYATWIAAGLVRGFKYRKAIDLGILKLHEYGIINHLKLKWLRKSPDITTGSHESIRIENVLVIFAMLLCGLILSLIILVIENIIYLGTSTKNRSRKRVIFYNYYHSLFVR